LYEVNEDIAKKIFEDTNALIVMRTVEAQVGGAAPENYSLTFTGDTVGDHVITTFNPNDYNLHLLETNIYSLVSLTSLPGLIVDYLVFFLQHLLTRGLTSNLHFH